jgi:hypothetical protein
MTTLRASDGDEHGARINTGGPTSFGSQRCNKQIGLGAAELYRADSLGALAGVHTSARDDEPNPATGKDRTSGHDI